MGTHNMFLWKNKENIMRILTLTLHYDILRAYTKHLYTQADLSLHCSHWCKIF